MKSSDIEVCYMSNSLKEKIEQLEKKHRVIADNLIDAIWSLDVETLKFDYITPSIERISGYTADEYINFTLQERLTEYGLGLPVIVDEGSLLASLCMTFEAPTACFFSSGRLVECLHWGFSKLT